MSFPFGLDVDTLRGLYKDQFLKLLPPGRALTRRLGSSLAGWAEAMVGEFARVHVKLDELVTEAYPGDATTGGLLPDWEELTALPDDCTYLATDEASRQASVVRKFAHSKGQSLVDYEAIAADVGYSININPGATFRTGVHGIGHMGIQGSPWLYHGRLSYESQDATQDAYLECRVREHQHRHTHFSFNPWDASVVAANLPSLRHHFIGGEVVTHSAGGLDIIDSWTNRSSGNDWSQSAADGATLYSALANGWPAVTCEDAATRYLDGLTIDSVGGAGALLKHGDFNLWLVFYCKDTDELDRELIFGGSSAFAVRMTNTASGNRVQLSYDGTGANEAAGYGSPLTPMVCAIAVNGTSGRIQTQGVNTNSFALSGGPYTGESLTLLSQQNFVGGFLEIIASDYEGMPGTDANVDAVTAYLVNKYGVAP